MTETRPARETAYRPRNEGDPKAQSLLTERRQQHLLRLQCQPRRQLLPGGKTRHGYPKNKLRGVYLVLPQQYPIPFRCQFQPKLQRRLRRRKWSPMTQDCLRCHIRQKHRVPQPRLVRSLVLNQSLDIRARALSFPIRTLLLKELVSLRHLQEMVPYLQPQPRFPEGQLRTRSLAPRRPAWACGGLCG